MMAATKISKHPNLMIDFISMIFFLISYLILFTIANDKADVIIMNCAQMRRRRYCKWHCFFFAIHFEISHAAPFVLQF